MNDEIVKYAVGIDLGTENVRAVVGSVGKDGKISVIGYNEGKNAGMRKGVPVNLAGPAEQIDAMLKEVERMSGYEVRSGVISVNGVQVATTKVEGMIAVGTAEHEVNAEDMARVEEVSVAGRVPANREILDVIPLEYLLDGVGGLRDPRGMKGSRLEMKASVVSALSQNTGNVRRAAAAAEVQPTRLVPSVVAAARAVLSERQMENGVAVVDMGATTTGVAVFEGGYLQYVGVIPVGSNNISNDLAILLEVGIETAEEIKQRFVTAGFDAEKDVTIKVDREEMTFPREKVDAVVRDRLDDIFDKVRKELKKAGYDRRLPEGIILTGGGAKMKDIVIYAKSVLEAAVKIGAPRDLGGVSEAVSKPEYAATVGLMLMSAEGAAEAAGAKAKSKKSSGGKVGSGILGFLKRIKF